MPIEGQRLWPVVRINAAACHQVALPSPRGHSVVPGIGNRRHVLYTDLDHRLIRVAAWTIRDREAQHVAPSHIRREAGLRLIRPVISRWCGYCQLAPGQTSSQRSAVVAHCRGRYWHDHRGRPGCPPTHLISSGVGIRRDIACRCDNLDLIRGTVRLGVVDDQAEDILPGHIGNEGRHRRGFAGEGSLSLDCRAELRRQSRCR